MMLSLGTKVIPITRAGLELADTPVNGKYQQKRDVVCVFRGMGTIIASCTITIDYDSWDVEQGEEYGYLGIGKMRYTDYLIQCENGIGWGGGIVEFPTSRNT